MKVIRALLEEEELTVVTSIDGCMDFLETLEKIKSQLIHYESDSTVDMDALKENLVKLGYEPGWTGGDAGTVFHPRRYCGYLLSYRGESVEN